MSSAVRPPSVPFPAAVPSPETEAEGSRDQRTAKGEATRARLLTEAMRLFAERGYHTTKAHAYDLFPRTHHVETIALLTRA